MNIHEHQAKEFFKEYNIPVSSGSVAFSKDEIKQSVKIVSSSEDAVSSAEKMFGMNLITPQTGKKGKIVNRVYIEKGSDIEKELYLSCLVDRETSKIAFIVSKMGGMDIEAVAKETPEQITTVIIEPSKGISDTDVEKMSLALNLDKHLSNEFNSLVNNLYRFFVEKDASLLEINPLIITKDQNLLCLDAKVNFDDNALFRHPEIEELRDLNEEDQHEQEAAKHDLAYIKLDGNIGCMVNGAGLAMASLDIIKMYGGDPANFLDVGGGATKEKVSNAFQIILSDESVKGILVNIFGGIMRCDIIAEGIVAAARELKIVVPLVVRLEGTNVEEGKSILNNSGIDIDSAIDLDDAAKKIVKLV